MSRDDLQLPPGTRLNDLYEIESHIADGGIGTVYKARDVESGDPVAVKVLLARFSRDPVILDLFKREAKILRKLKHDALTQYYVFTREPTLGVYYLAMEFVSGPSLSARLDEGPLSTEATYTLVKRVASALQAVHDRDVIHRDLSPDNIVLQNGDVAQAKIIDFGIARANTAGPTIIGDGFAGKINYVSPEQVGIFDGKVTPRSDIYSLGLVIAEALTGKQIDMGGTQVQIVEKRRIVPHLEGVDPRFRPLLEAMLQPDPANRPATMNDIAEWTLGAPMQAQQPDRTIIRTTAPPPEQTALDLPPPTGGWGKKIAIALSLLGFAGIGAAGVYFFAGQIVPEEDRRPVLVATPNPDAPKTVPPVTPPPAQVTPQEPAPADTTPQPVDTTTPTTVETPPVAPPPIDPVPAADDGQTADGKLFVPELPDDNKDRPPRQGETATGKLVVPELPQDTTSPPPTARVEDSSGPMSPEDRIRKFIGSYQAGDCMYLQPIEVASNSTVIEGFASRTPPFIEFDQAFTSSQGFEAKIQVNIITDAQCPAVTFLRATPTGNGKTQLVLNMQRTVVQNGATMAGRISGFDPATGDLALVYVSSKGEVNDLSPYLLTDDGGAGFAVPMTLKQSQEEIGLIIAMVGPGLANRVKADSAKAGDPFFSGLVQDVSALRATATTVKVTP